MSGLTLPELLMPLHPVLARMRSVSVAKPASFRLNLTWPV
jgi:hypothetical protein